MTADTNRARNCLIVRGGWDGHQPVETTAEFIPFLEKSGFAVKIEESSSVYADEDYLKTVDLIVQCNTMSSIEKDEVHGLRAAIERGTGLAGWHGGIADSYRNSSDYLQLIGGQFAAHPARSPGQDGNAESDNFVTHTVNVITEAAEHPIMAGIDDFELETEQYWVLHDGYNDVLATTTQKTRPGDPWKRPIVSPAIWTRQWGAGRVFVSTPGHDLRIIRDPNVRTIIERGMLWASR